jgi:hypothetical protein
MSINNQAFWDMREYFDDAIEDEQESINHWKLYGGAFSPELAKHEAAKRALTLARAQFIALYDRSPEYK